MRRANAITACLFCRYWDRSWHGVGSTFIGEDDDETTPQRAFCSIIISLFGFECRTYAALSSMQGFDYSIVFFGCMHVTFRHVRCGTSADPPALRIGVSTILRTRTRTRTRTLHDDLVIPPSPPIR
jgi:hypothetical protein